ncbi:MAG: acetyl-CoA carboxylase biotin carboxyl carrier protein [Cyclobacteriaceae bacterium]
MKAKEIQELIDFISQSGLDEVNIETEEFKLKVKKYSDARMQPASPAPSAPAAAPASQPASSQNNSSAQPQPSASDESKTSGESDDSKYLTVKSPMIGTFYRSSSPDSPAFVNVGDKVNAGETVCIVEAMKLFNEIESEVSGTIVKVLIENASPVEYDQPLFLVDPS